MLRLHQNQKKNKVLIIKVFYQKFLGAGPCFC